MFGLFKKKSVDNNIYSPVNGEMIDISTVNDEMFSQKLMGDGVAFILKDNIVFSPCNGTITAIFPTGHAFGIKMENGVEILVHIGINTVELDGKGFTILPEAKINNNVTNGIALIELDLELLKESGYDLTTMLVVTDTNGIDLKFDSPRNVSKDDKIIL